MYFTILLILHVSDESVSMKLVFSEREKEKHAEYTRAFPHQPVKWMNNIQQMFTLDQFHGHALELELLHLDLDTLIWYAL